MVIEIFGYIAAGLAIFGVLLNNRRMRICFYVWMVSNAMSIVMHVWALQSGADGMVPMIGRDVVFLVLAVEGAFKWKNK